MSTKTLASSSALFVYSPALFVPLILLVATELLALGLRFRLSLAHIYLELSLSYAPRLLSCCCQVSPFLAFLLAVLQKKKKGKNRTDVCGCERKGLSVSTFSSAHVDGSILFVWCCFVRSKRKHARTHMNEKAAIPSRN